MQTVTATLSLNRWSTVVFLLMAILTGCAVRKVNGIIENTAGTKELSGVIEEFVPVGTSVNDAAAFMERSGFKCQVMRNSTLSYRDVSSDGSSTLIRREGEDFLHCTHSRRSGFVRTITSAALVLTDEDRVAEVVVYQTFVGP